MKLFLSIISALLAVFSFYNFDLLIFFSLIPFLLVLGDTIWLKKRFVLGYLWGIIFFSILCYWLVHLSFLGLLLLVSYLSLYPATFALLFKVRDKNLNPYSSASLWILLEFLRSFLLTGFPWGNLGYALAKRVELIQVADLAGAYGVSFLIVFTNATGAYLLSRNKFRRKAIHLLVLGLLFAFYLLYGRVRLKTLETEKTLENIALIQTNIPSEIKWNSSYFSQNFEKLKLLLLLAKYKGAELIITPETVLPYAWGETPELKEDVEKLIQEIKLPLLLGSPYYQAGRYYNASILFSEGGKIEDVYFKNHLVPFGEYLPFPEILSFLGEIYPIGSYSKGKELKIFHYAGNRFSVLICYENIFSELAREATLKGADFLINQSDEAWFRKSSEIYLHNQIAIYRTIENRRSLLRATNTGLSCLIDPGGKLAKSLEPFKEGVLLVDVPIYKGLSFYVRKNRVIIWLAIILAFCGNIKAFSSRVG